MVLAATLGAEGDFFLVAFFPDDLAFACRFLRSCNALLRIRALYQIQCESHA